MINDAIEVNSEEETGRWASALASRVRAGETLGLSGPLGSGKTTLIRYLVAALGCTDPVSSPSYVLQHIYELPESAPTAIRRIEHWDLYRLHATPEELLDPPDDITLRIIEWPERAPELSAYVNVLVSIDVQFRDDVNSGKRSISARTVAAQRP